MKNIIFFLVKEEHKLQIVISRNIKNEKEEKDDPFAVKLHLLILMRKTLELPMRFAFRHRCIHSRLVQIMNRVDPLAQPFIFCHEHV